MTTLQNTFVQAQLAEAAYANFVSGTGVLLTNDNDVKEALTASGFSASQASEFVLHWRVVDHIPDTINNGFSATVFESLDNLGEFSLAI